jgi:hypothetical protein
MGLKFNPFSGNFDFTGSGGGQGVFDGEVQFFSDLPQTVGVPPVNSAYLVREPEGTIWFGNKKQKGIYIRSGNSGVRNDDWTYGGEYPVTSVNGETGAVVLDAGDVGAAIALEFLTISSAGSGTWTESLAANKYYTISQNSTGAGQLQLPTSANNGDRIFIRVNPTLASPGNVSIVRLGGSPFIQQIGLLRGGGIFEAIWNGLWTANLPIAAGLTNVPSTPTADGQAGSLAYLDPYFYVCVANNNWRRIPVAAW